MLASLLKIEALLKCDLCGNLLRSTRTLTECGHRFCENCIYDRLGEDRACPQCHLPAIVKNLRKDPKNDTLVACVKKLKYLLIEKMDKGEDFDFTSLQMTATFDTSARNYNHKQQQQFEQPSTYFLNQSDKLSQDSRQMDTTNNNENNLHSLTSTILSNNNHHHLHFQQYYQSSVTSILNNSPGINSYNDVNNNNNNNNSNNLYLKKGHSFITDKNKILTADMGHPHLLKGKQPQLQRAIEEEGITANDLLLEMEQNQDITLDDSTDDDGDDSLLSSGRNNKGRIGSGNDHRLSKLRHKPTNLATIEENVENLLLKMEDNEDINNNDTGNNDDHSAIKNKSNSLHSTHLNKNLKKENNGSNNNNTNKDQASTSVNDLLIAMESEEIATDDDFEGEEEDKNSNVSRGVQAKNKSSHGPQLDSTVKTATITTPTIITTRRNDVDMFDNRNTNHKQKTDEHRSLSPSVSKRRRLTFNENIPQSTQLNVTNLTSLIKNDKWKCTFCKFVNNMDQETCAICRYQPKNKNTLIEYNDNNPSSVKQSLQQQSIILPNIDTSSVFIPATIQITASQTQATYYSNQPICIMSTALNKNDSASIESAITKVIDLNLKLEICSSIRDLDQVTHIITSINSDGLCTRTSKYLLGIITGKWIIDTSWLLASIQAGYWLPEQDYEVRGDRTLGYTSGPKHGRERDVNQPFFHGRQFFFYGEYSSEEKLSLMQLVTIGGGTVHSRRPPEKKRDIVIIIISSNVILLKKNKSTAWLHQCKYVKDRLWLIETAARGIPPDFNL